MSKKEDYEKKTTGYIMPILEKYGFSLYDLEYVREGGEYFLRAYIDKPEGITIEDCVTVSREMNEILDREDYIEDAYTFEVSSPGVERVLKKDAHFESALGKPVFVRTYQAVDGRKEFEGILESFSDQEIALALGDGSQVLQRKDIANIHLAFTL